MTAIESLPASPPPLHRDQDGTIRVGGTRVTLETVVGAFRDGATPEEIVRRYPVLNLADVYAVIAHVLAHPGEVDAYLEEQHREAQEVREKIEARFPTAEMRERLRSRRNSQA